MDKQQIISFYLDNGTLISPELLDYLEKPFPLKSAFSVLNKDALLIIENKININLSDYEKAVVLKEKNINNKIYDKFKEYIIASFKTKKNTESVQPLKKELSQKESSLTESSLIESSLISSVSKSSSLQQVPKDVTLEIKNSSINRQEDDVLNNNSSSKKIFEQDKSPEQNKDISKILTRNVELAEYKEEFMKKNRIKIIHNYIEKSKKRTVQDFINYFNSRFKEMEKILRARQELQNLTSIGRIISKKEKDNVAIIGMVYDKQISKNNNIILTIEDPTGVIKAVITRSREDLFNLAQEIQLDEIIGLTGSYDNIIFVNNILLPDVPLTKELKKSPDEGYFVVITDPQVGNKLFLESEFKKFLQWIKGDAGSLFQKDVASKIKYLFLVGDMVDGVGIYPGQEYNLSIIDVKEQYVKIAEYLKEIPNIPIIICPGNHDVGRIAEPQPGLKDDYSRALWSLPNVISLSNPSFVNIYAQPENNFEGLDVLLYHGYSFFYYFTNSQQIRSAGGPRRPDLAMRYLLQRRHLAPTHTSNLYIPDSLKDPLVIDKVPDFFFSGHIHRASVTNYRNVTCINASCWVSKSEEEERRGLDPQPGRAFVINMQTREVKIMNFLSKEDNKEDATDAKSREQILSKEESYKKEEESDKKEK